jgi:hypothetical protein
LLEFTLGLGLSILAIYAGKVVDDKSKLRLIKPRKPDSRLLKAMMGCMLLDAGALERYRRKNLRKNASTKEANL